MCYHSVRYDRSGQTTQAFFTPQETTTYVLWFQSDNEGELLFGTSANISNVTRWECSWIVIAVTDKNYAVQYRWTHFSYVEQQYATQSISLYNKYDCACCVRDWLLHICNKTWLNAIFVSAQRLMQIYQNTESFVILYIDAVHWKLMLRVEFLSIG